MKKPSIIVLALYAIAGVAMLEFCTRLALVRWRGSPESWEYVKRVVTAFAGFPGFGVPGFAHSTTAATVKGIALWAVTLTPAVFSGYRWGKWLTPVALLLYVWAYVWTLFGIMVVGAQ